MINHILKQDSKTLLGLLHTVQQIQEMQRIFTQYLEPNIGAHCKVSKLQNNCLIVIVDSGNWATQLRFHIPDLILKLQQHAILQDLKAICCKTRPNTTAKAIKKASRQVQPLSEKSAKAILETAGLIQDEKLRRTMERIAGKCIVMPVKTGI